MMDVEKYSCSFKNLELPEDVCLRRTSMNLIKEQIDKSTSHHDSCVFTLDHDELIQLTEDTSSSLAEIYTINFSYLSQQQIDTLKNKGITHLKFYTSYGGMWLPYRQGEFEPLEKFLAPNRDHDAEIVIIMMCLLCVVVLMLYPYLFR